MYVVHVNILFTQTPKYLFACMYVDYDLQNKNYNKYYIKQSLTSFKAGVDRRIVNHIEK